LKESAYLLFTINEQFRWWTKGEVDKSKSSEAEVNDVKTSLTSLESSIEEQKQLIFQKESILQDKSTKGVEGKGRGRDFNPSRSLHRAIR